MAVDAPTPREFGRLEERVDVLIRDVGRGHGELTAKIDTLNRNFAESAKAQGERIGKNEQTLAMLMTERRMVVAVFGIVQTLFVGIVVAAVKGWF